MILNEEFLLVSIYRLGCQCHFCDVNPHYRTTSACKVVLSLFSLLLLQSWLTREDPTTLYYYTVVI